MGQNVLATGERNSEFRSNSFVIKKPGKKSYDRIDSFRLISDLRLLNKICKPIASTLPFIETLRQNMRGFELLTKLDIASAFFSISVHPDCVRFLQTTTSNDSGNLYYQRTPQGLYVSPDTFQTTMTRILDTITDKIQK